MIKYVSNAFLAMMISFINDMADACEYMGASIDEIIEGIGMIQGSVRIFGRSVTATTILAYQRTFVRWPTRPT